MKDEKKRATYDREHGIDRMKSQQQNGKTPCRTRAAHQTNDSNFSSPYPQKRKFTSRRTSKQYNEQERQKRAKEAAEREEETRKAEVERKARDKKAVEDLAESIRRAREYREKREARTLRSVEEYRLWKTRSAAAYLGFLEDWKVFSRKVKVDIIDNDIQLRKAESVRDIGIGERKVRVDNLKENADILRERLDSGWMQFKQKEPAIRARMITEAIKMQETVLDSYLVPVWRGSHASLEHWRMLGHVMGSLHSCQFWDGQMDGECSRCHGPASRGACPTCGVAVCSDCIDDLDLLREFEGWLGGQESLFEITFD